MHALFLLTAQGWANGTMAQQCIQLGWPVFPLMPNGKKPLYRNPHPKDSPQRRTCRGYAQCGQFGHGVLDATTDPDLIRQLWERTPQANIGLATGWPGPDVVDIDVKDGAPGEHNRLRLTTETNLLAGATALVRTPTGGLHLYYPAIEQRPQPNGAMAKFGIDFRGTGGYVVAPPSRIGDSSYRFESVRDESNPVIFDNIRQYLDPPKPRPAVLLGAKQDGQALLAWYSTQGDGTHNRNNALFWAACQAIQSDNEQILHQLTDIAVSHGLPYREVEATIASARRRAGGRP